MELKNFANEKELDEYRYQRMKDDIDFFNKKGYKFTCDFEKFQIKLNHCLFEFREIHAIYINPHHHESGILLLEY